MGLIDPGLCKERILCWSGLEDVECEQVLGSSLMHSTESMCVQLLLLWLLSVPAMT